MDRHKVFDTVVLTLSLSLLLLILTDTRWLAVIATTLVACCVVAMLIYLMRHLSYRMMRQMSDPVPDDSVPAFCKDCGQVVEDMGEHFKKSHGQSAR